jgi:hypothetical protein
MYLLFMLLAVLGLGSLGSIRLAFREGEGGGGGSGESGDPPGEGDGGDGDDDDAGASDGDDDDEDDDDNVESLKAALRRANKESKSRRLELRKTQGELEKLRGESMSESQKVQQERDDLKKELDEARSELRKERLESRVGSIASRLGAKDPDLVIAMVESGRIELEEDDDGKPINIEKTLKAVFREKPHLLGASTGGGSGNGEGGTNPRRSDRSNDDLEKLPLRERAAVRLSRAFETKK